MRYSYFLLVILFLASATIQAGAQSKFQLPANIVMQKDADFLRYNKDIIACVNWLESTPLGKEQEKRKQASAFLVQWAQGTPDVTVSLHAGIMEPIKENMDIVNLFIGGYVRYILLTKDPSDKAATQAGLRTIMKYYKGNNGVGKMDAIEKFISLEKQGKLDEFVALQIKAG